jgi:hypothetical protein
VQKIRLLTNKGLAVGLDDSAGQKVEIKFFAVDDNGVTSIVASLQHNTKIGQFLHLGVMQNNY